MAAVIPTAATEFMVLFGRQILQDLHNVVARPSQNPRARDVFAFIVVTTARAGGEALANLLGVPAAASTARHFAATAAKSAANDVYNRIRPPGTELAVNALRDPSANGMMVAIRRAARWFTTAYTWQLERLQKVDDALKILVFSISALFCDAIRESMDDPEDESTWINLLLNGNGVHFEYRDDAGHLLEYRDPYRPFPDTDNYRLIRDWTPAGVRLGVGVRHGDGHTYWRFHPRSEPHLYGCRSLGGLAVLLPIELPRPGVYFTTSPLQWGRFSSIHSADHVDVSDRVAAAAAAATGDRAAAGAAAATASDGGDDDAKEARK